MKHDLAFMRTAEVWQKESTCFRLQVGAVIADDNNRILSIGYNGTVKGFAHCNDYFARADDRYAIWCKIPLDKESIKVDAIAGDWWIVSEEEWRRVHHEFALKYEVHAEQNAIYNLIKAGVNPKTELTMYTTVEPCDQCCKAMIALGIKRIVYKDSYDSQTFNVREFLKQFGVEVVQWK